MVIIDRILVPADFSVYSEDACLFAEKVALNTENTVLTIRPDTKLFEKNT